MSAIFCRIQNDNIGEEKFRKLWCEQQLVASQERRRVDQDPNDDRARYWAENRFDRYFANRTGTDYCS
ncbi:9368_t:CDS:2 [Paraglomus brasilianum]|uniref:9368_t:CDS:1 n=1 Tax=Paraglomus brasilianum TaxID=144538 RepID=A0A9N9ABH7_9GLOM|nr:9368_t:CDS:2 [Paraglomus brasilianum]